MELRRWRDILAIKTKDGKYLGYHSRNLEVAEVSKDIWEATQTPNEASEFLQHWSEESPTSHAENRSKSFNAFTINVTQVCNLHCKYCAAGGDGTYGEAVKRISVENTLPQLKFFIEKLSSGESIKINFVGGEPLLYPEGIRVIVEYVNEQARLRSLKSPRYKIVTNGTQFSEKTIELLKFVRPYLVLSLDGPPEINDQRRPSKGGQGVTAKIVEGLNLLTPIRSSLNGFEISGVFGPGNMDLQKAYDFYVQLKADHYDFIFDHHCADKEISQQFINKFEALLEKIYAKEGESGIRKIITMDAYFQTLDSQVRVENFCGAGKNFLVIDAKNNIYTCPWDSGKKDEMVGSLETLSPEGLAKYADPLAEKSDCKNCWARYMCGGGCMYVHKNSTGSKNKVDEMFCFRTRNLISLAIMYYERSRNSKELPNVDH